MSYRNVSRSNWLDWWNVKHSGSKGSFYTTSRQFVIAVILTYWDFVSHISLRWRHNGRDGVSNHHGASRLFTQPFIRAHIKVNIKSSASLAFVWGIHRGPVNSPHKWPVTRKMFPFDDVIMAMISLGNGLWGTKPLVGLMTPFVNERSKKPFSETWIEILSYRM